MTAAQTGTILERGLLKTRIPDRDMSVCTAVGPGALTPSGRRWTTVFRGQGPTTRVVWLEMWPRESTPGGLAEAHEWLVQQVKEGTLPARDREAWEALDTLRGRDPDCDGALARARPTHDV